MANNSVFGQFFKGEIASLTAGNADFKSTLNQTGIPGDVAQNSLSSEFGAVVNYVHKRLGSPVMAVELTPDQIGICFEEAQITFSAIVSTYMIESWAASMLGLPKDYSQYDFQNALPKANDTFFKAFANSQVQNFGIYDGLHTKRRGYVVTDGQRQLYDVYSEAFDAETGLSIEQYTSSITGYGVHFTEFYIDGVNYMNRLYDPLTNQQFLASEFGFPAYPTDTVFYILPLWQDLQRGQVLHDSDYTRKSQTRWSRVGRKIEFIPRPRVRAKVWFDFYVDIQPGTAVDPMLDSSFSGFSYLVGANAKKVGTNFGNVPISDLTYDTMNSVGRTWVRKYTLASCMETLGFIRGKLGSIPIPGSESIQLNYDSLLSRGQAIQQQLEDNLRTELAKMDSYEIIRKEADKAQQLLEYNKTLPFPIYMY